MAFLVRWVHVTAVSIILGGALLLFILFLVLGRRHDNRRVLLDLMQAYEWSFWGAVGLAVMTGVGNLGHFGASLPERDTEWGRELTLKLGLVGVLLALSTVRSLSLALVQLRPEARQSIPRSLQGLYGATSVVVAGIIGVAVALAHF